MNTARASKRQKLDTPTKESIKTATPLSRKKQAPQTASKRTTAGKDAELPSHTVSPAPYRTVNLGPTFPSEITADSPAPQSALEKLKARRAAQNRNCAGESSPASRPSPSKPKTTVGFFERFTEAGKKEAANGTGKRDDAVPVVRSQKPARFSDDRKDKAEDHASDVGSRSSTRAKRLISKDVSSAAQQNEEKGKTFEDEIRELEAAARREVEERDAATATPTRASGRRSAPAHAASKPAVVTNGKKKTSAKARVPPLPPPQPETEEADLSEEELLPPEFDNEAMEVDESSVDERELYPELSVRPVQPESTLRPTPGKLKPPATEMDDNKFYPEQLQILQKMVLERFSGKRPIPLTNLHEEYVKVNTIISQTITAGESNSMLLIGARGSGKTALTEQILREQTLEHPDEFHVVRLNGFVHTDDKIALREIWRQLGREMELDEDESTTRNYADTLATLLALLSHPAELGQEQAPGQSTKSVVFILDEFELFASHLRQTLLYNLFDIAQSRKAPIAVLGLTTRIDVAEALEKRVKSRFSHRYVHLSLAKNFGAFVETCKAALTFQATHLSKSEKLVLGLSPDIHDKLFKSAAGSDSAALNAWNTAIASFLTSEDTNYFLLRSYYTTKSLSAVLAALHTPFATLPLRTTTSASISSHLLTSLASTGTLSPPDSKVTLLPSLSILQLALLVCAARQTAIHNTDAVSFDLAYEEYKVLASKAKIQAAASGALGGAGRVWGKGVSRDAWEGLMDAGLVMDGGRVDVALEEIGESGVDLGGWSRWCREI